MTAICVLLAVVTLMLIAPLWARDRAYAFYIPQCLRVVLSVAIVSIMGGVTAVFVMMDSTGRQWDSFTTTHRDQLWQALFDPQALDTALKNLPDAPVCTGMQQVWLEHFSDKVQPLAMVAACHVSTGNLAQAKQAVAMGLGMQPRYADLNYLAAEITFTEQGSLPTSALDRLMLTLRENPEHTKALWLLLNNSMQQKQFTQAAFFLKQLQAQSDGNPKLQNVLFDIQRTLDTNMKASQKPQAKPEALQ